MFKISTEIASIAEIVGERKAVELCAKAGFDGWDFSMFDMARYDWRTDRLLPSDHPLTGNERLKFARELRKIGEDNGIRCNQSHAPFPVCGKPVRDRLYWAIECTAEAGGEICVIHPDNHKSPEENAEMYLVKILFFTQDLLSLASCHHVRSSNLYPTPQTVLRFHLSLTPSNFSRKRFT